MAVSRKTVTVLFADVADSTGLGERLDPEALRRVMSRYFETTRAVLERHGGTVEKFIGDAVMAVFGIPRLHEDDALRAVRAADELTRAFADLNRELERDRDVALGIRIGINTGEVVAGDGSGGDHLVTGDTVNVAKRLEEAARAGEVIVGSATERLARAGAMFDFVEPIAAKGKSQLVEAWRLVGIAADGVAFERHLDTPLVGREQQLAELVAAFDAAVAERACRRVTVVGPAGIGKSRLATELCHRVERDATVLVGRCLPYGDGITYWPLVEVIRALGGEPRLAEVMAGARDAELVLARLGTITGDTGAVSQETFWAFRRLCETLARDRPLVLTFEDVHWAEPTFVDLLDYVTGWVRDAPILLLCLARPELAEHGASWLTAETTLELGPLSTAESEALLDAIGAAGPARARIAEAAEGNPLYAEQMAAMVAEAGFDDAPFTMPPSIHALLSARLDRLTPPERGAIERAAVAGKEFALSAVTYLTPADDRADVNHSLLALARKGLIRPHRSRLAGEDAFTFAHALIRDAAYSAIAIAARADLHERFAGWIERHVDEGELDEIVGYHLEQAFRSREQLGLVDDRIRAVAERAGVRLGRAGRRAFVRRDLPAAVTLLTRASALLPAEHATRLAALPELGSALMRTGDFGRADSVWTEALAGAVATGDKQLELRTLIEREFFRTFTEPETTPDQIVAVAEAAIPLLEEIGDELGLSKAWWLLAEADVFAARWGARAAALERALEHARRAGDQRDEATLVSLLAQALAFGPTPVDEAISRCEALRRSDSGDSAVDAGVATTIAVLMAMRGEIDEARTMCREARAALEDLGLRLSGAGRSLAAGWIELLAGDADAAARELRAGHDELAAMGERSLRPTVAAYLAYALAEAGRLDEAEEFAAASKELAVPADIVTQVVWRAALARALAHRGEMGEAERLGRKAVDLAASTDFLELQGEALVSLGEVLHAAGRSQAADLLVESARKTFKRKGNVVSERRTRELLAATSADTAPPTR
jgi:class 3 adenylate cyclase/tetratricopeptide (TPR) repeat protein